MEREIWGASAFTTHYREQHLLLGQSVYVDTDYMVNKCITLDSNRTRLAKMKLNALSATKNKFTWKAIIRMYEVIWSDFSSTSRNDIMPLDKKLDYWGYFKHYATKLASDEDQYVISNYGNNVIRGNLQLQIFDGLKDIISMKLLELILEQTSTKPMSVNMIASNTKFNISKTRFHFSFLLKHGLLSVSQ